VTRVEKVDDRELVECTSTDGYAYFSVPKAALAPQKLERLEAEQDKEALQTPDTGWAMVGAVLKPRKKYDG
jgi:hypothetical protein